MVMGSNRRLCGVNGVVYGRVFEFLSFGGQCWCSAWSLVRIFDFLDVIGDVVHGRGFKSFLFVGQLWRVHGRVFELTLGGAVDRGVVQVMIVGSNL
jgi:hypothetical protein